MASTLITLIDPAAGQNGNAIADAAATPVVQTPADRDRNHTHIFRITGTQVHDVKVYGFADKTSTTLTDGTELESLAKTNHAATSGNGYELEIFSTRSWEGYAVVITNKSGGDAGNFGVYRVVLP